MKVSYDKRDDVAYIRFSSKKPDGAILLPAHWSHRGSLARGGVLRRRITEWCRQRAKLLEIDIYSLYLAYKDPRVPLYAKLIILGVVGYVYSPIDLIPDLIPVIGYLDDLIVVSAGVWLSLRMIPPGTMAECRAKAQTAIGKTKPDVRIASAIVTVLFLLAVLAVILLPRFRR